MADAGLRAVLFDVDGTLIASGGASDRAWRRAFAELYGRDVDVAAHTGRGVPDPEVGREAFRACLGREPAGDELERLMARRLERLPAEVESSPGYRVMDGARELLAELAGRGVLLGLVTGNVEPAARIKLAPSGLDGFFSFGGYGSDSPDRAELTRVALARGRALGGDLEPRQVVAAGDTPRDVAAGHAAGVRVAGVATGEYSTAALAAAGADWALASLREWDRVEAGL